MGKILLYIGLYITLISMSSTYLVDFGKSIINSTGISSLTQKVSRIDGPRLNAKDFKLISSTPHTDAVMKKFTRSISSLQFNDVILAKILAEKKKEERKLAQERAELQSPQTIKVARQIHTLRLRVDSTMESGAIINGRFYQYGDELAGAGKIILKGFNRSGSMIRLGIEDNNYQFKINDGLVDESITNVNKIAYGGLSNQIALDN